MSVSQTPILDAEEASKAALKLPETDRLHGVHCSCLLCVLRVPYHTLLQDAGWSEAWQNECLTK